ncbi:hypothetical protein ID866_8675 [Astraeus odoratus]|nr:hypothetical protein ID866_8675 [Astraeus odoratus]
MAGLQLYHWSSSGHTPFPTSTGTSTLSAVPLTSVTPTAPSATVSSPAVLLVTAAAVPSPTWGSHLEDLACLLFGPDGNPSPSVLVALTQPSFNCNSLLDSGASHTLVLSHAYFWSYQSGENVNVNTANHGTLPAVGSGDCLAYLAVGDSHYCVHFTNCFHTLGAVLNVVSVSYMLEKGWECNFMGGPPHCNLPSSSW